MTLRRAPGRLKGAAVMGMTTVRARLANVVDRTGDACPLGMVTLEELGPSLDPLKRTLRPLRLMIA